MKLHHIGHVVVDLEVALEMHQKLFGGADVHGPGIDELQQAEIAFVRPPDGQWIELLRPTSGSSPLAKSAAQGGGLHHLAYAVEDVRQAVNETRDRGGLVVSPPKPAPAFGGLEVAFVFFRHAPLIEYVDSRALPPFFGEPSSSAGATRAEP